MIIVKVLASGLGTRGASRVAESTCQYRRHPWFRRSPGEGDGYRPQYSCLGNPRDRGAWWATVHAVTDVTEKLHTLDTHALRDLDSKKTSQSHLHSRIFHLKGVLALKRKENEASDLAQPYPFTEAQRG